MSYLNVRDQVLEAKVVYYGAGLSGKTTNLVMIRHRISDGRCGEMMSLNTDGDRTLFFDWLPLSLGRINGCDLKVQLYTVPGQAKYVETRKRVLRFADGVVLVLDSASGALDKNRKIVAELRQHVQEFGLEAVPLVVQLNKRDLPSAMASHALLEALGLADVPMVEAVASEGRGVLDTLKLVTRLVLEHVRKEILDDADAIARGEGWRLDGNTLYEQLEGLSAGVPMRATSLGSRTEERAASGGGTTLAGMAADGEAAAVAATGAVVSLPAVDATQSRSRVVALPAARRTRDRSDVALAVPSEVDTNPPLGPPLGPPLDDEAAALLRDLATGWQELGSRLAKLERAVVDTSRATLDALASPVPAAAAPAELELLVSLSKRLEQLIANVTCVEADQEVLRVRIDELDGRLGVVDDRLVQLQQALERQPALVREHLVERLSATQGSIEDLLHDQGLSHRDHLDRVAHEQRQQAEQTGGQLREVATELRSLVEHLLRARGSKKKRWW